METIKRSFVESYEGVRLSYGVTDGGTTVVASESGQPYFLLQKDGFDACREAGRAAVDSYHRMLPLFDELLLATEKQK